EISWGHDMFFRSVPAAHTLVRGVDGKRLHRHSADSTLPPLWPTGSSSGWLPSIPARSFSASPSDSTSRWTPCPPRRVSRPARRYPRFWIWRSPSEHQWDFNPPEHVAAQRTLPADPTSTTASAPLWMVHSVGLLDRSPVKTVVDLPGSVTLPYPPVPCSQTPPESPAPSPLAGAYWCLPSFRPCRPPVHRITRLNRFTCVTARTSLGLRLAHVVTSTSPRLDSRWGGSFPLPGRELHPLEAPGLTWRTEVPTDVGIKHPVHVLAEDTDRERVQRVMLAPPWSEPVRETEQVHLVDGVEHLDDGSLDDFVLQACDAQGS